MRADVVSYSPAAREVLRLRMGASCGTAACVPKLTGVLLVEVPALDEAAIVNVQLVPASEG